MQGSQIMGTKETTPWPLKIQFGSREILTEPCPIGGLVSNRVKTIVHCMKVPLCGFRNISSIFRQNLFFVGNLRLFMHCGFLPKFADLFAHVLRHQFIT